MGTGDKTTRFYPKKKVTHDSLGQYLSEYLRNLLTDHVRVSYINSGRFAGGVLSSNNNDSIDISAVDGYVIGADNPGRYINAGAYNDIPFVNVNNAIYHVGLKYQSVFDDIEINERTGDAEYLYDLDEIGEQEDPTAVVVGASSITFDVTSVTEAGVSHAGRTVRVWLKDPQSSTQYFEDLTVAYGTVSGIAGTINHVTTTHLLGQTSASTTASDYLVWMKGPTITSVDISSDQDYLYLGSVTGSGSGTTPTVFDQTSVNVLNRVGGSRSAAPSTPMTATSAPQVEIEGSSAAALTTGDALYIDSTGKFGKAASNSVGTMPAVGFANEDVAGANLNFDVLLSGIVTTTGLTPGAEYYVASHKDATILGTVAGPYAISGSNRSMRIAVAGVSGSPFTVTLATGTRTAAQVASDINNGTTGITASAVSGAVQIVADADGKLGSIELLTTTGSAYGVLGMSVGTYAGEGPGGITSTPPTDDGEIAQLVGQAISATELLVSLSDDYLERDYIRDFIGKSGAGQQSPSYGSTNYVTQGTSHNDAISALDDQVHTAVQNVSASTGDESHIRLFIGKGAAGAEATDYSSTHIVNDGDSLEAAIGKLDAGVNGRAALNSPVFTGSPRAPTPSSSDDSTRIATTAWVNDFFGDAPRREFTTAGSHSYTWEWGTENGLLVAAGIPEVRSFGDFGKDIALGASGWVGGASDGTTLWFSAVQGSGTSARAYVASTQARDSGKDINISHFQTQSAVSDGTTLWFIQTGVGEARAYVASTQARDSGKDININRNVQGATSDGTTLWFSIDLSDEAIAYNASTQTRDSSKDIKLADSTWVASVSDGTTLWFVESTNAHAISAGKSAVNTSVMVGGATYSTSSFSTTALSGLSSSSSFSINVANGGTRGVGSVLLIPLY